MGASIGLSFLAVTHLTVGRIAIEFMKGSIAGGACRWT
jgi:hypothetical protein